MASGGGSWALKRESGEPPPVAISDPRREAVEATPEILACARCHEPITSEADRLEMAGAREHTFTNPHGFRFRIGCFAAARSLRPDGGWSAEWSWFPPCEWQVQHCARCGEHLGWLFRGGDRFFYGLVLDRLVALSP
jgi:hypothetical protein